MRLLGYFEMRYYLFENPTVGIILALVVEFIMLLVWGFARQRCKKRNLLIGPILVVVLLLVDFLFETSSEAMERVTREVVRAVEEENPQAVLDRISEDFIHSNAIDKEQAGGIIRQRLRGPLIRKNNIRELQIVSVEEGRGQVNFRVTTLWDENSKYIAYAPGIRSRWKLEFIRDSDGQWRVVDIVNLGINNARPVDVFSGSNLP